jgi:hypothetical protein
VAPCNVVVGHYLHPKEGDSKVLRNVNILPQRHMVSQHIRPGLESSPPRKPRISHGYYFVTTFILCLFEILAFAILFSLIEASLLITAASQLESRTVLYRSETGSMDSNSTKDVGCRWGVELRTEVSGQLTLRPGILSHRRGAPVPVG